MTAKLNISNQLSLPVDLVTESIAIIAIKRAGKSYTARRITEQIFKAEQQIVIVDPKGDWWGVRSSADGKGPGLSIVILGGEHGDIPLEVGAGELVARMVVEQRVSVLLDLSGFRKHEVATFMTAFLETLYRLKAQERYRTPMILMVDEADAIAPQRPNDGEQRMLGAAEDIVRRGGQRGIGICLITQRAAVLNKNVLTQCGVLVLLRTTGSQDIDALDEWIKKHGQPDKRAKVMESIASLPTGTAWIWAPGWPDEDGIFQKIEILRIETYDSGATPKVGERREAPKTAADVDLAAFSKEMAATIEKQKASDPKHLQKRVRELEAELARKPAAATPAKVEPKIVEKLVLKDDQVTRLEKAVYKLLEELPLASMINKLRETVDPILTGLNQIKNQKLAARGVEPVARPVRTTAPARAPTFAHPSAAGCHDVDAPQITPAQSRILGALAEFEALGRTEVSKTWVAALAGASHRSSAYTNNLGALRSRGLIDYGPGGTIHLTPAGLNVAPPAAPLVNGDAFNRCVRILTPAQSRILTAVYNAFPDAIAKEAAAEQAGASPNSSAYTNNLGALRSAGMIEYVNGAIKLSDWIREGHRT